MRSEVGLLLPHGLAGPLATTNTTQYFASRKWEVQAAFISSLVGIIMVSIYNKILVS